MVLDVVLQIDIEFHGIVQRGKGLDRVPSECHHFAIGNPVEVPEMDDIAGFGVHAAPI